MLKEFKDFINKGNVFDAAVGLIMALAFQPVITSVVDDLIMPIVAAIIGEPDFSALAITIGDAKIMYGNFLTVLISFVMTAFVIFLLVKAYNRSVAKKEEEADSGPSEIDLLTEIRDSLSR